MSIRFDWMQARSLAFRIIEPWINMDSVESASCFDTLAENVIAVLSTIQIVSDIIFANEVKQAQIFCAESCQCAWNQGCSLSDAFCSNGAACPSDPRRLNNLYIATVFFTIFPLFLSVYLLHFVMMGTDETYLEREKKFVEDGIQITRSKKKLTVLVNGEKQGTFYHYRVLLPKSREATLSFFRQFDSKIQILKNKAVLLPIYGFCHACYFIAVAINLAWIAKIVYPKQKLPDQESIAPEFRVLDSPEDSLPKITSTPAVLIVMGDKLARINLNFTVGTMFKSFPQFAIQMIFILSIAREDKQGTTWPMITLLFTGANLAIVLAAQILFQLREEGVIELKRAQASLRRHFALQGHLVSEIQVILE
jgi:heme/copper-type cytochrome/quinol oxidase subunit 4